MAPVVSMLAPEEQLCVITALDSNYSEFLNNVPLTREVTESWRTFE